LHPLPRTGGFEPRAERLLGEVGRQRLDGKIDVPVAAVGSKADPATRLRAPRGLARDCTVSPG